MKTFSLLFAAVLLLAALPDPAAAQSRTADGWWDWVGRTDRDARTERASPRTERDTKRRGTIRPRTDRRRDRDDRRRDRDDPRRDRDDDWDDDRWDDRRHEDRGRHNAPPFCRNGQGHPTKGMAWCYDKGYGNRRTDDRWERRSIEDIIFGTPRDRDRRTRTVSGSVLDDILGRGALRELAAVSSGALAGRWVYPGGASRVLQLRDGRGPLAEMTDFDGDGRVDLVLVNRDR